MGIFPSVTKRYEGVGVVTSALRNVIFLANTAWFTVMSSRPMRISK